MNNLPRTLDDVLRLPRVAFLDRGLLPSSPGVYFVLFEANPVRLAYVGKAEDFRARWTGHHREPDLELLISLGIAVEIAWVSVPKATLATVERELIGIFRPPLNDRPTHQSRQHRLRIERPTVLSTAAQIVQDFRDRRGQALDALNSDEFWDACNNDDGDLLCLWPFPDEVVLPALDDVWSYRDSHPIRAFRVPNPPSFEANTGGWVSPEEGFRATSAERRQWIHLVALQVDAWLSAVATYQATAVSPELRREVLSALAREQGVVSMLAESDQR